MLCSKSHCAAGLRQPGPVQVAFRIWDRCRSLTPGSWPLAWYRWSQSPAGIGSRVTIRSRCPGVPVGSRQVPYPSSGGPCQSVAVKANPGPSLVPRGGSRPSGGPGFPRFSWCLPWLLGSGRAQPWPMAWPCSSVTVTHQVVVGFCAAAFARSRARSGSMGPEAGDLAGPLGQAEQGGQRDGQVDLPGEPAGSAPVARPAARRSRWSVLAGRCVLAGPGVGAEQQVHVGARPQLIH